MIWNSMCWVLRKQLCLFCVFHFSKRNELSMSMYTCVCTDGRLNGSEREDKSARDAHDWKRQSQLATLKNKFSLHRLLPFSRVCPPSVAVLRIIASTRLFDDVTENVWSHIYNTYNNQCQWLDMQTVRWWCYFNILDEGDRLFTRPAIITKYVVELNILTCCSHETHSIRIQIKSH